MKEKRSVIFNRLWKKTGDEQIILLDEATETLGVDIALVQRLMISTRTIVAVHEFLGEDVIVVLDGHAGTCGVLWTFFRNKAHMLARWEAPYFKGDMLEEERLVQIAESWVEWWEDKAKQVLENALDVE